MKAHIVKMHFTAPLHLGSKEAMLENTLQHIPSDVVFSALCNVYRHLYGKQALESLLAEQAQSAGFLLSSAFPYYRDAYFLPRPLNFDLTRYGFEPKKAKRVKYLEYNLMHRVLAGKFQAADLENYVAEAVQGLLLPREYQGLKICREVEIPRVALDSLTAASNIYYFNQVTFTREAGLYCLVRCAPELWGRLKTCFRVLGDEGIGGDRTSGKGGFAVEFPGELAFPQLDQPASHVLLSLYYPGSDEARNLEAEYALIKRSGYVYSSEETGLRRKSVTMLAEGAVVYADSPPVGKLVDLTPPGFDKHKVWRNGLAFAVASALGKGGGEDAG